jgi:hypothetical protein
MAMNPRLLRPLDTAFNPKRVAGLALWFDADDASTITLNGSTVSEWRDKSGYNRHATQATAARQPAYTTNSLNGKPAVTAPGADGLRAMLVSAFQFYNAHTAMFVFKASGGYAQTVFNRGSNNNDRPKFDYAVGPPRTVNARKGGTGAAQVSSTLAYTESQWSVGGLLSDVATIRCYLNGVYGTDQTGNTESWSDTAILRLFSLTDTLLPLNGGIAEFIYYDKQLTASEVARVAKYLSKKWNIALS